MPQNDDYESWLESEQELRKKTILRKIEDLRQMLDSIEHRVLANTTLNDLGELQAQGIMLDTAIAAYATQRQDLRNYREMKNR